MAGNFEINITTFGIKWPNSYFLTILKLLFVLIFQVRNKIGHWPTRKSNDFGTIFSPKEELLLDLHFLAIFKAYLGKQNFNDYVKLKTVKGVKM